MGQFRTALVIATLLTSTSLSAHEVWMEPMDWRMQARTGFTAQLLNGQNLEGQKLSWDPRVIVRAEIWQNGLGKAMEGRFGDVPALSGTIEKDGLLTLVYQSRPNTVVYKDFATFTEFLTEKNHPEVLEAHAARQLPETSIKEAFSRFSKALIAVGTGTGADAPRGLEIEIVALDNPYTSDLESDLRFQALYRGAPLEDNRVTLFERNPAGVVTLSVEQTDAQGIVSFTVTPENTYLVDTVVIRQPSRELFIQTGGVFWESLWASLTFNVPKH